MPTPSALHATLEETLGKDVADEVRSGKRRVVTSCGSGMTAAVPADQHIIVFWRTDRENAS